MITLKAAHAKDFLDKESEYLSFSTIIITQSESILGSSGSCFWTEKNYYLYRNCIDKNTGKELKIEKTGPVVKDNEKNLKLLADSWRMAQEIDKAIPVLKKLQLIKRWKVLCSS